MAASEGQESGARGTFMEGLHPDEQLRLLDRAVASSEHGIVIVGLEYPDAPIVYVNPAFERLTGYPPREALGRNCRFLQGADRDQPALEELRAAVREGRPAEVQLRNYRRDGTPFDNQLNVAPVYGATGHPHRHMIGVQHDVTRRVTAEREVRRLNRELVRLDSERETQLETLFVALAHGVQQPTTSLSGLAALLLEATRSGDAAEAERIAERIRVNAEEAHRLVQGALVAARAGQGDARRRAREGRTHPSDMGGLTGFSGEDGHLEG